VSHCAQAPSRFLQFIAMTFGFGWIVGLAIVFKLWQIADAPRWMMFSGTGYVTLMLGPPLLGFICARVMGWLAARGFAGAPLGLLGLGVVGLVAGLIAL
jgi:hypothetical protein